MTIDHEAAVAVGNRGKVDGRSASCAEDHIGAPGGAAGSWIAERSPNDEIGEAIAVHIASTGHAGAVPVVSGLTIDHEAAVAVGNR